MAVAAGSDCTFAVDEDGSLFSFGRNMYGELGTGDTVSKQHPTRVGNLPSSIGPVRQVACGYWQDLIWEGWPRQRWRSTFTHTGIVTDAGDLFMCGLGMHGQLGLGDNVNRTAPTLVPRANFDDEAVLMVACGSWHSVVVTEKGSVFTFGRGRDGKLGYGTWDPENQLAPRRLPETGFNNERIVMVAAGTKHTVALSEAGHVFTWGNGAFGQLGHYNQDQQLAPRQVEPGWFNEQKVVFVAAGYEHSVAVTEDGSLWFWGYYYDPSQMGRLKPTPVGVGAFGGSAVKMAACGHSHILVVTQDGALWVCGIGSKGQLGLNSLNRSRSYERVEPGAFGGAKVVAAAAGYAHSAAVTEDGALWTWGCHDHGRLGHIVTGGQCLVPTRVDAAYLNNKKIGRCHSLSKDSLLAFVMGTQDRLGWESPVASLAGESGLLYMIAAAGYKPVDGDADKSEGLLRLIGRS